jgi:gas vesicle protein
MNSAKLLTGLLLGVAAGATIAILFAPAKGSETRKRIADKKDNLVDTIADTFNQVSTAITDTYQKLKAHAEEFIGETEEKVIDLEEKTKNSFS